MFWLIFSSCKLYRFVIKPYTGIIVKKTQLRENLSRKVKDTTLELKTRNLGLFAFYFYDNINLLRLFGQQVGARRDSGLVEKDLNFLIGCPITVCIVLPQKSSGNKIPVPRVSPGNQPLAKEPKDTWYEIATTFEPFNPVKSSK